MFKSKQIELEQNKSAIKAQEEKNVLKKQEIEEIKRHNLIEEETKDRVDISKKEYLQLLKTIKTLENDLSHTRNTLQKILLPFTKNKIDEHIVQKIIDNKFEAEIKIFDHVDSYEQELAIVYKIPLFEIDGE